MKSISYVVFSLLRLLALLTFEQVQAAQPLPSGQAPFSCPRPPPPASPCPSRIGGSDGSLCERPVVAHLVYGVPASRTPEEPYYRDNGVVCAAVAVGVPDGLVLVADDGEYAQQQEQRQEQRQQRRWSQQQQQASVDGEGHQAGETLGNLVAHGIPYPHPLIWEEPALGKALRNCFAVDGFGGVL